MTAYRMRLHRFLAENFARKRASRSSARPMISFTFDDFPRSALTVGGKMLFDRGWKGTYYAALGLMGRITNDGEMFKREDLNDLLAAGHELACHTFHHASCYATSTAQFISGCTVNRNQATTMLDGYRLQNFSMPHGHITLNAKRLLNCVYDTCRSIEWGVNSDPVDLGMLRANPIYSRHPIERIRQLIATNSLKKGWLILYTHDVTATPTAYGCTPSYFEQVLHYALESRADVVTIREAASRYRTSKVV